MRNKQSCLFAARLLVTFTSGVAFGKQIVINEIMRNPASVASERNGEWFELFNPTNDQVDINSWTIKDDGSNHHVIKNGGPLTIAAGGYLVLGNNIDFSTNGGVAVDYDYGSHTIQLSNNVDELILLTDSGIEVDRVNWDGGSGASFPNHDGAAMALRKPTLDNNFGRNWCNAATPYGQGDLGTPGASNDCPSDPPKLVINEIMRNPARVSSERDGEWFELFNPTEDQVDINGWTIKDDGTNSHVINNKGPLTIAAGGYLVLGNNVDFSTNGGVVVNYDYGSRTIQLSNNADELVLLTESGIEVDRVNWDGGSEGEFPNDDGSAMALLDPTLDNTVASNWCDATTPYGEGDMGTPGAANDCPPPALVINEIMRNPANVATEREGEWFEIFNPTNIPMDINGWTIEDDGSNKDVISNGGPLSIPPGGYLVLGNNGNFATNGGVIVDYEYDTSRIQLSNGNDELNLVAGSVEVDRVKWDGGPNGLFPNSDGVAMALRDPKLDNNAGTNWCKAATPYGAGDKGTPGAANDCPNVGTGSTGELLGAPSLARSPSSMPSENPSVSLMPSYLPSQEQSVILEPSKIPSNLPSISLVPLEGPSDKPSLSQILSAEPSDKPTTSQSPSEEPSNAPSLSGVPSLRPSASPSVSYVPSNIPSDEPSVSQKPSTVPSRTPSASLVPSTVPSNEPSISQAPSVRPSDEPSISRMPSFRPSQGPSISNASSSMPSHKPSIRTRKSQSKSSIARKTGKAKGRAKTTRKPRGRARGFRTRRKPLC